MIKPIDFRSDTMTKPSQEMKEYMMRAELGDDVWGEDPTVIEFQEEVAALLEKEAALFLPTATQANLIAILCHCQRGEEYIVGNEAHCYRWEAGGAAVLGSVQPQPIPFEPNGTLDLERVEAEIKPDDPHFAVTKLLCVENTQLGKVIELKYLKEARNFVDRFSLGLHMDGARAFNAAVALGVPIKDLAQDMDTVTLCFSKGLGCPTGAMLVGSKEKIKKAIRWRKMLGGGLRQVGIIAAAAQYAIRHNIGTLADDHRRCKALAQGIEALKDDRIVVKSYDTNMLFVEISASLRGNLQAKLKERGIIFPQGKILRLVTHRDINDSEIGYTLSSLQEVLKEKLNTIDHVTIEGLY